MKVGIDSRRAFRLTIAAIVAIALGACGADASPEDSASAGPKLFEGTPEEHSVLRRACIEDKGFTTSNDPNGAPDGFGVSTDGKTQEELIAALEECNELIGEPKMANLSEAELQERYDVRVAQFECLIDKGLIGGEPLTFEVFVERYNRSGQEELWEPTAEASMSESGGVPQGPTDVCPRSAQTW